MAEIPSSQESLVLSQETIETLWSEIPPEIQQELTRYNFNPVSFNENSPQLTSTLNCPFPNNGNSSQGSYYNAPIENGHDELMEIIDVNVDSFQRSALPGMENYPGLYNFSVSVPNMNNGIKKTFVYSSLTNKAYVKINLPCHFNISVDNPKKGLKIRAMLYFTSMEYRTELVSRCKDHEYKDKEAGIVNAEHLLKCESASAEYFYDDFTKRCSVIVPFENPPCGQNHSTYLYKFGCFTSCIGGPNRRPFSVVFTLEDNKIILGRYKVDLKVCACPQRDMVAEEGLHKKSNESDDIFSSPPLIASSSQKRKRDDNEEYVIRVKDEECYKLLKTVEKYYHIQKFMKNFTWVPTSIGISNILAILTSHSEETDNDE